MVPRRSAIVGLAGLFCAAAALASPDQLLVFERLGPENGLPHNTVNDLLQDRQGFLWLATDGGLSRYDGYGFASHRIDPTSGASNVLMALLEDRSGELWVGSETGLWRFDRAAEEFRAAPLEGAPEAPTGFTQALLEDRSGRLWAGVGPALYAKRAEDSVFARASVPGPPFERVWSLASDSDDGLWAIVGDAGGLHPELRRIPGVAGGQAVGVSITERFHVSVFIDSQDRLWTGPIASKDASAAPRRVEVPELSSYLNDLVELDDGRFWLASAEGLFLWDPESGRAVRHRLHRGAPTWQSEQVRSVLVDHAGGLWVGTLGGLFHHDPHLPRFRHWRHDPGDPDSLSADPISDIVRGPSGDLWIGTFGGGLNRVDPESGRAERFRHDNQVDDSLPGDVIWSLAWEGDDRLWVGVKDLRIFDPVGHRFERIPAPQSGASSQPEATVVSLRADGRGRVWLGTQRQGLFAYEVDTGSWVSFPDLDAQQIVISEAGLLWIGSRGSVARLNPATGESERFPLSSTVGALLPDVEVLDLHDDGRTLWVATTAGLARLELATESWELPVESGRLPGTVVFSIQSDDRGRLWLGTNQGLVRFSPEAQAGGRVRSYELADGIGNVEFNRHSRYRSPDGMIYMGGMNGVTFFRPDQIYDNPVVPPVLLTRVQTLGRKGEAQVNVDGLAELRLPPGTAEVTFSFTALNFTRAERNRYEYMLEGFDAEWIHGGNSRAARYTNVPPGAYRFRVRAANNDGLWNETGMSLPVVVRPAFWQTWWFRVLALAAIVAAAYQVYRLRVRRLIELERMRLRIAGDLHDELGSELSGIALATSRLAGKKYLAEADRRRLADVSASSVQVMQGLRDIVWYVNPDHDSMRSLEARMRSAASVLLGGLEHHFEVDLPGDGVGIDMGTRRGIYLIFKELLTNAARHAGASRVETRLVARNGEVLLEVADDGVGFNPADATDGSGLASVRRRAAHMKASLDLTSRPGSGCRVRLSVKMTGTRQSRDSVRRLRMPE